MDWMWKWRAPTEIGGPVGENVMNLDLGRSLVDLKPEQLGPGSALDLRWIEIDEAVLALVPPDVATLYQVIPVRVVEGELWVATAAVCDTAGTDAVATLTGKVVHRLLGTPDEIRAAIARNYRPRVMPGNGWTQFGNWFNRAYATPAPDRE